MSIYITGLCFSYGSKEILHDINLTVPTGKKAGIIGVSGGGKSTLLRLVSGLYPSRFGRIEVFRETKQEEIRRNVAMVMQNAMLLPVSIRENITCGHPISGEMFQRACDAAQLTEWIGTLPEGADTFVGERGGKVSGGQAQRIAIARAIARDAPVILLDEATSALDQETGSAVLEALANLTKGKTVLSVSHRPEALADMDEIYRLEGGRLFHA
ncbi:ABC-type multidrug transport system fused ATPase/permease subunit [Anaerotaenia torta]|uniref:ATP-binding cassette domain-containing protein n=1 Tax=Anaerotaenia torta TaxID=433293 RepID=UPI003D261297